MKSLFDVSNLGLSSLPVRRLTLERPENPSAFDNARWEIEYLRTYTDGGHRASSTGVVLLTAVPLVSLAMLLF